MSSEASGTREESIIVDGLTGTYPKDFDQTFIGKVRRGRVTVLHMTVPDVESFNLPQVMDELANLFGRIRGLGPRVRLVTDVKGIRRAKVDDGVAVILGSQGAGFLGLDINTLELFAKIGMKTMQPTYQQRNQFGNGCGEKTDDGLSKLGIQWVEEMNRLRIAISLSHVGYKTSMDIMEISKLPVMFDHSNPKALCNHPRNITDEQMLTCAEKGGMVSPCPLSMFLSAEKKVSDLNVMDFIKHIDYVCNLIGIDHVGIGLDISDGHYWTADQVIEQRRLFPGLASAGRSTQEVQDEFIRSGREKLYFYELYCPWLKSIADAPIISQALLDRGYSSEEVKKIMGENFLAYFERVWGA